MLIDTKVVVAKTQLRQNFSRLLTQVKTGKTLVVSDRGQIIAMISPPWAEGPQKEAVDALLSETLALAQRLASPTSRWQSLSALKKSRRERTHQLTKS